MRHCSASPAIKTELAELKRQLEGSGIKVRGSVLRWCKPALLLLEQSFQIIVEPRHTLGVALLVRSARLRCGLFGYLADVVAQNGDPIGEFSRRQ